MGTMSRFECTKCDYGVTAPEGISIGMHAVIEPQLCNICKDIVCVTIGYYGRVISYKDMTYDEKVDAHCCPECHNMDLSDWDDSRKCPKCSEKMIIDENGGTICWD